MYEPMNGMKRGDILRAQTSGDMICTGPHPLGGGMGAIEADLWEVRDAAEPGDIFVIDEADYRIVGIEPDGKVIWSWL